MIALARHHTLSEADLIAVSILRAAAKRRRLRVIRRLAQSN